MFKNTMEFDDILKKVGDFDRFQKIIYLIICLPAALPSAWTTFNQVFVAAVPDHWCKGDPDFEQHSTNSSLRKCFQYNISMDTDHNFTFKVPCQNGWNYDRSTYLSTIVTQFNLVCDLSFWPSLCTMIFYVGSFIGNIVFGYVADKWGRRASFFSILTVQVIFGTANAFAPDIFSFTALRFLVGLTFPALYQIPFIIGTVITIWWLCSIQGMELMGPPGRIFAGIVVCVFFGCSMCLLGIVASLIRRWSLLTIVSNTPFVVLFSYWWFLPESPRWLVSQQKFEEASKVLMRIAHCNRKDVELSNIRKDCVSVYEKCSVKGQKKDRHNILDLFKTPNLRKKTIAITYIWFVNAVVYNGLTLNVSNLPVNDYLSFSINGAVEVPAYLLIWPLLDVVGRRWPLCVSMLLGGISCICTMFVPEENGYVISGLAFLGKFGIAASFAIIYIFAGELYPTVVRAIGMGMSSMVAGSGLLLAPYLVNLGQYLRILPLLVMGGLTISAGVTSMFLPETVGSPLPQTILEAEEYGKNFPLCHCNGHKTENDNATENPDSVELLEQSKNYTER